MHTANKTYLNHESTWLFNPGCILYAYRSASILDQHGWRWPFIHIRTTIWQQAKLVRWCIIWFRTSPCDFVRSTHIHETISSLCLQLQTIQLQTTINNHIEISFRHGKQDHWLYALGALVWAVANLERVTIVTKVMTGIHTITLHLTANPYFAKWL